MQYLTIYLKGIAMGCADLVPGVSGGTVAFISGIYERLLHAIKSINLSLLKTLKNEGIGAAWKQMDGTFLLALVGGILTSVFSFAKLITAAIEKYPALLWSFFFGLVLASAWYVMNIVIKENKAAKALEKVEPLNTGGFNIIALLTFIIGIVLAYISTTYTPEEVKLEDMSYFMFFVAGAIAICAMILPGISGSFILLLMGMYTPVLEAVKGLKIDLLICFALGCGVGILAFSHVLSWMLSKFRSITLALIAGFLLGSLNKVWPWQNIAGTRINSKGLEVPSGYTNVMPSEYTIGDPMLVWCIIAIVLGFSIILIVEKISANKAAKTEKI